MTQFWLGVLFVLLVAACIWQYRCLPVRLRSFSEWLGWMVMLLSPCFVLVYVLSK